MILKSVKYIKGLGGWPFCIASSFKDQKDDVEGRAIRVPHVLPRNSGKRAGKWGFSITQLRQETKKLAFKKADSFGTFL